MSIKCGEYHVMALTMSENLYSWGDNRYGQLGLGNNHNQNVSGD